MLLSTYNLTFIRTKQRLIMAWQHSSNLSNRIIFVKFQQQAGPRDSAAISVPPLQCAVTPSPLLCRQAGDENETFNHLMSDEETITKAELVGDANASATKPKHAAYGGPSEAVDAQGLSDLRPEGRSGNNNNKKLIIRPALSVANFR